jgi:FkbH-like protein
LTDTKTMFSGVKNALDAGDPALAVQRLRYLVTPDAPFDVQRRAAKHLNSASAAVADYPVVKIAILAGSTVDHLVVLLRYWLAMAGLRNEIYIAPYDMVVQTILDEGSELYAFKPDIVWLCTTFRDLHLHIEAGATSEAVQEKVNSAVEATASLWQPLLSRLNCAILQNNGDAPLFDPFGELAGGSAWGTRTVYRLYNAQLATRTPSGVQILDLDHLSSMFGKAKWVDARYWFHSKHAFSFDASGLVAHAAAQSVAALKGLAKKCLVLDLDNTLWGGVIGDDGLDGIRLGVKADGEAFVHFQSYVKSLKDRGIILAICSKNEELNAKQVFVEHPDMRLRLGDIAVFRANWNNKVDNIRDIAKALNIGLDSLVFVDDNPAEREIVRQFLPMVAVPDLPEDPSGYVDAVAVWKYFESACFSDEDRERSRYYQENAQRAEAQMSFADTASYLSSLDMVGEVEPMDDFHRPRVVQLINKSNQFHLTGTRYTEAELMALADRPDVSVLFFKLKDRFGDNGLISAVVLKQVADTLHVDTWVMSCRVLGRSMEEFILNDILLEARRRGCAGVEAHYVPSAKNKLVANLYQRLGFECIGSSEGITAWRRSVGRPDALPTQISRLDAAA